jgi:hypothetical protein
MQGIILIKNNKIYFDPTICDDCYKMVQTWCWDEYEEKINTPYLNNYKNIHACKKLKIKNSSLCWIINKKLVKDPQKDKLKEKERKKKKMMHWHKKESKINRRKFQKKFRQKMKRKLLSEEYYNIRNKDYHTYGWMTW